MGTSNMNGVPRPDASAGTIHQFYSSSAWIEGKAEEQLQHVSQLDGVTKVTAFPDLHPGKYGPVGCAILSERIYPQLIGNDIGCGMSLFILDVPARKLKAEKAARRLRVLEGEWRGNPYELLEEAQLSTDIYPYSLGTIGGGNHFCELQTIAEINDSELAIETGFAKDTACLLVHSGSRGFGMHVFSSVLDDLAKGMNPQSEQAEKYLSAHNRAVRWASLNRHLIARRAAEALRADFKLITDAPHNLIEKHRGSFLHRKGAAKADIPFVPLAGSRDSMSYLLKPESGARDALLSLAHGAGRKYDRSSMHGRIQDKKSDHRRLQRTSFGGHVVCEDKQLLIEEAPEAYKSAGHVLKDLEAFKLARSVATFQPLVTFKKAAGKKAAGKKAVEKVVRKRGEKR